MEALENFTVDGCGVVLRVGDEVWRSSGKGAWRVTEIVDGYVVVTNERETRRVQNDDVARRLTVERPDRIPWIWQ